MIRSAEHELWDAALATSEARADFNTQAQALTDFARRLAGVFEPVFADISRNFAKLFGPSDVPRS